MEEVKSSIRAISKIISKTKTEIQNEEVFFVFSHILRYFKHLITILKITKKKQNFIYQNITKVNLKAVVIDDLFII